MGLPVSLSAGSSGQRIDSVENPINDWLAENAGKISIEDNQMCVAGSLGTPSETYSIIVICAWYDEVCSAQAET